MKHMETSSRIAQRNREKEPYVHASCFYGRHAWGKQNFGKQFSMLAVTDVHRSADNLAAAVDYLNYQDALDCGICLGDIHGSNFSETDGVWYTECVLNSRKPFYTVIGNHDVGNSIRAEISGTSRQAFEKFILPTAPVMNGVTCERPYYAVRFDDYRLVMICLDGYDAPDVRDGNGDFCIDRGEVLFSQAQLDWLADTMLNIPCGYHLLICLHSFPYGAVPVDSSWTQKNLYLPDGSSFYGENMSYIEQKTSYGDAAPLADLVNVWKKGTALKADYAPIAHKDILPTLHIHADFSGRGTGIFCAYLMGHYHCDLVMRCRKYPDQNAIALAPTALDDWQNYCCDLPRVRGSVSEDCVTVVSVCTDFRQIRLVRLGSDVTFDMRERKPIVIPY